MSDLQKMYHYLAKHRTILPTGITIVGYKQNIEPFYLLALQ